MAKTMKETKVGLGGLRLDASTIDRMGRDATEVGIGIITVMAVLIGLWAFACLFGAIAQTGLGEMISGYITAVTGH